jgi:creatinine amidohydrolase/Fe(II)-dependent formamide hydrolase-like protein
LQILHHLKLMVINGHGGQVIFVPMYKNRCLMSDPD